MDKLLTIVIPTYNMQAYLHRCLDSLIVPNEQMALLEVLVINDGSKDKSSAIAHEYETKYPSTFRVIDKENGNYGSCINRGLVEASGKYIKVLDADDWYDTKNFEAFIEFLKETDVDLVVSDFSTVTDDGVVQKIHRYNIPDGKWKLTDCESVLDMWMHAVTYRTAIFKELQYHQTEGISYTDQEWIFACGLAMLCNRNPEEYPDERISRMLSTQFMAQLILIKSEHKVINIEPKEK